MVVLSLLEMASSSGEAIFLLEVAWFSWSGYLSLGEGCAQEPFSSINAALWLGIGKIDLSESGISFLIEGTSSLSS